MSCNKPNCCKKNNLPREEMNLDVGAVAAAFTQMLQVAKTGVNNFQWASAELVQLAQLIVTLVRKPEPAPAPDVSATHDQLTLRFGPQNAYALHVPAGTEKQRNALITQLLAATVTLSTPPNPRMQKLNQLPLPFSE
jgi:hypothetical protein